MKKFIISIFTLIVCLSSIKGKAQSTAEELSKNEDLRMYVITSFTFIEKISNNLSRNEIVELQKFFENKENMESDFERELATITAKLKLESEANFIEYYNSLSIAISGLQKTFGTKFENVDQQILIDATNIIIQEQNNTSAKPCAHPWRYGLCAGAVSVEGTLAVSACLSAAGVTAGALTAPAILCVSAVTVWAANGILECSDKWCLEK